MIKNEKIEEILKIIKEQYDDQNVAMLLDEYHFSDIADVLQVLTKEERFKVLCEIAKYQLTVLNNAEKIKLLEEKN